MKRSFILVFVCALLFLFGFNLTAQAVSDPLNVYFFNGKGCPHCAKEEKYLDVLKAKYPSIEVKSFEIYYNAKNAKLLQKVAENLNVDSGGVPFLVIGDKHFIGYAEGITPREIEAQVIKCLAPASCPDPVASIIALDNQPAGESAAGQPQEAVEKNISLPLLGEINAATFSLPLLTIVMGLLDGFNPCAMWTLLFLISLLLGMKDRKKMWILGVAFIVASASVYFVFMAAWLNLILFLGFVIWIRLLIGLLALFGGVYSLKDFVFNKSNTCAVTGSESCLRVLEKLKAVVSHSSFWLSLGGIIVLAFAVNLVELICSAGLPAVYTQVLALNNLAGWQYYLYILAYVFFFMLDDLVVFFVAMMTLKMTGITTKYAKYSRLIGGMLMLLIGLMLIFKPEWLMFG